MPGGIRFSKWQIFIYIKSFCIDSQCRYRVAVLFQMPCGAKFVWADSDVTGELMPKRREFLFLWRCCRCRVVALFQKP